MVRLGAHISISGGVHNAPERAAGLGVECFQIFAKNQRQWNAPDYTDDDLDQWRAACKEHGFDPSKDVFTHASYLINPCADTPEKLAKARAALVDELERADQLGIHGVCFHPGSHTGQGVEKAVPKIVETIEHVLAEVETDVLLMPEVMAGQGTSMGRSADQLAAMITGFDEGRVGVTLDTCHLYAAGFDLRGDAYEATMEELDDAFGLDRVGAWHLNDSKHELGSNKDRHERIGEGELGVEGFEPLMRDARFDGVIASLETDPLDDEMTGYKQDLDLLRKLSV